MRAREELAKANAEIEAQRSVMKGREDSLTRLTFNAPVRGIVKDIDVTTVGGVIPPNGKLMSRCLLTIRWWLKRKFLRVMWRLSTPDKSAGENHRL